MCETIANDFTAVAINACSRKIMKFGLRVFVQRFVVNVAKPKIAVSLTTVSAAVFRHPAGANGNL
jgi:hypothetical protein